MKAKRRIFPVLLSGGTGTRLWPLSRAEKPKQLLPLLSERTLLQDTALRVGDHDLFEPLTVILPRGQVETVRAQLVAMGADDSRYVVEPMGRDTAAAAAVAAFLASRADPDAIILLMPADHRIADAGAFQEAVLAGLAAAEAGRLVLFGMKPDRPATGYGYIETGAALRGLPRCHAVSAFVEKPEPQAAARYVAFGRHLWNSGIFLLPARALLAEFEAHAPEIAQRAREALGSAVQRGDELELDASAFALCPARPIDRAIMEVTRLATVVPADFGWTDVGAWSALWDIGVKDKAGNVAQGDVVAVDTRGSYIRSEGPIVATLGVSDLVIVVTEDAVLIADKSRDQDVKAIVERLKARDPKD